MCVQIHGMSFIKPAQNGDILEIKSRVAFTGTTSITVSGEAFINEDSTPVVSSMATFVTVDKQNKSYAHGLVLPEEYIENNRTIYEKALQLREAGR